MAAPALVLSETSTDLFARQLVSAAMTAALRDPWTGAREPSPPVPIELLADAWDILAAPHAGATRAALGLGESPPIEADPAPLVRWFERTAEVRERVHALVFGLVISKDCPPYETEFYPSHEAASRAQHMADAAGFYHAFGLELDARTPERPDHASLIIGFVSFLLHKRLLIESALARQATDAEHEAIARTAMAAFIKDHVAWWLPALGRCLELRAERVVAEVDSPQICSALSDIAGVGRLLRAWVAAERINAGVEPSCRIVGSSPTSPDHEGECGSSDCAGCAEGGDSTSNGR